MFWSSSTKAQWESSSFCLWHRVYSYTQLFDFYFLVYFSIDGGYNLILGGDSTLLRDVDTIEELTQILLADVGSTLDLSGGEGDESNVVTTELDLILDVGGTDVLDTLGDDDLTDALLSEEVTDLDGVAVKGDVDGEMRVDESHLVEEAAGDTDDHVVDVRADGTDAGELGTLGEPKVNADLLADLLQVHVDVLEVAGEFTAGSLDGDATSLDLDID